MPLRNASNPPLFNLLNIYNAFTMSNNVFICKIFQSYVTEWMKKIILGINAKMIKKYYSCDSVINWLSSCISSTT